MRRVLCIVLTFLMMSTGYMWVSADDRSLVYPLLMEDFESGSPRSTITYSGATMQIVPEGAGGSNYSALATVTANYGNPRFSIQLEQDQWYRISAWVKVRDGITNLSTLTFLMYFTGTADKSEAEGSNYTKGSLVYVAKELRNIALKVDEWVYLESEFQFDGTGIYKYGEPEIACTNTGTAELRVGSGQLSGSTPARYYLDDFMITPIAQEEDVEEPPMPEAEVVNGDFQNGLTNWTTSGNTYASIAQDGEDSCAQITTSNDFNSFSYTPNIGLSFNKTYKISFSYKLLSGEENYGAEKQFMFVLDRTAEQADTTVSSSDHPNQARYVQMYFPRAEQTWQHAEVLYKHTKKTIDGGSTKLFFRIGEGRGSLSGEVQYLLDNVKVESIDEIITNGEFDTVPGEEYIADGVAPVNIIGWNSAAKDSYLDGESNYFWGALHADIQQSDEVRNGAEGNSLKVSQTQPGGSLSQGVYLKDGTTYTVSFWAKAEDTSSGADLRVYLDRQREEYPDAPIEQLTENSGNTQLSAQWQQYSYTFVFRDCEDGILPILLWEPASEELVTFYMDSVTVVADSIEEESFVEAENLNVNSTLVVGNGAVFSYTFNGTNSPGACLMIIERSSNINGLWNCIKSQVTTDAQIKWELTEEDAGQRLRFTVVPVDSEGKVGNLQSLTTEIILTEWTGEITLETQNVDQQTVLIASAQAVAHQGEHDISLILCIYDENNTLLNIQEETKTVGSAEQESFSLSLTADSRFATVKAFLWGKPKGVEKKVTSYVDCITYQNQN